MCMWQSTITLKLSSIEDIDWFLSCFSCPAAYVNYIRKDPGAPCSLTEALEYLQVDILEDLIKNDSLSANQVPPKHKPHNLTVVAMEGCHSFIILDWARPLKDDMVSGKNLPPLLWVHFRQLRGCNMKEGRWSPFSEVAAGSQVVVVGRETQALGGAVWSSHLLMFKPDTQALITSVVSSPRHFLSAQTHSWTSFKRFPSFVGRSWHIDPTRFTLFCLSASFCTCLNVSVLF